MERAKGFEPSTQNSETPQPQPVSNSLKAGYTQIRAHAADVFCPDLARVVAAWDKLPASLKAAILAIVDSIKESEASQ